ncbi:DUF397 domain-containing protein [Actinomadura sp. KC06]|uniref:DUF397 domain-containing protein n=1 Tax=Actinomadura sp. KC06 TaxID=2530369 RepID=UPI00104ABCD5|nr:DUF397 domain-containing protein [Actinomadura sp. KC06]TDD38209.1 DUF397 domain-containing protein [Actinomadura sp. KC06]
MENSRDELTHVSWRKSSRSQEFEDCVRVARIGNSCAISDSKDPDQVMITLAVKDLRHFIHSICSGEHDLPLP